MSWAERWLGWANDHERLLKLLDEPDDGVAETFRAIVRSSLTSTETRAVDALAAGRHRAADGLGVQGFIREQFDTVMAESGQSITESLRARGIDPEAVADNVTSTMKVREANAARRAAAEEGEQQLVAGQAATPKSDGLAGQPRSEWKRRLATAFTAPPELPTEPEPELAALRPGHGGWTSPWAVQLDAQGNAWLDLSHPYNPEKPPGAPLDLHVERDAQGNYVAAPSRGMPELVELEMHVHGWLAKRPPTSALIGRAKARLHLPRWAEREITEAIANAEKAQAQLDAVATLHKAAPEIEPRTRKDWDAALAAARTDATDWQEERAQREAMGDHRPFRVIHQDVSHVVGNDSTERGPDWVCPCHQGRQSVCPSHQGRRRGSFR